MILCSQGPLSIVPLDGGKAKPVPGITAKWAQYVSIGYILYTDDRSTLQALPFDAKRLEAKGPPFPLLEDVESFDISSTGTLLCRRGGPEFRTVQWVDESGKTEPIIQKPGFYGFPQLSPDGKRLALTIRTDQESQIWIYDLEQRAMNRLILDGSGGLFPLWMPGGKYLLFRGGDGVFLISSDGSGKPRRILETDGAPESVSPDGRRLALSRHTKETGRDVWMVTLSGVGDALQAGKPEPFINGVADELNPSFSRWQMAGILFQPNRRLYGLCAFFEKSGSDLADFHGGRLPSPMVASRQRNNFPFHAGRGIMGSSLHPTW